MTWWKPLVCWAFLNRRARIDFYATVADLLDADFSLEAALAVTIQTARDQGRGQEAWIIRTWRDALVRGSFAGEVSTWIPASEAMIFMAYGEVDAAHLFAGAARVADLRQRQTAAVLSALAMPALLIASVLLMLWGAGGWFIPVFQEILPDDRWPLTGALFRDVSLWLFAFPHVLLGGLAAAAFVIRRILLTWKGPGRSVLDRIAPFSIYRTIVGSAFLFVLLEYLRAGVDLNDATFERLRKAASPYTRHRIAAIQRGMARGRGMGRAMTETGHGFPDPALIPVGAALDDIPAWEIKLARFIDRWVLRSEAAMKARAAVLNMILILAVTVIVGGLIQTLFTLMGAASRPPTY